MIDYSNRPAFLPVTQMPAAQGHVPSLDGLRAISILLVLAAHLISTKIFPGGLGVFIFFEISGFLITRLLFAEIKKNGRVDIAAFFFRRALRLYPVVLVYAAAIILTYAVFNYEIDWIQPLSSMFYFSNYLYSGLDVAGDNRSRMPFEIFWSLSIEEHFYLLFPAIFVVLRGRPRTLLGVMLAVVVGALALRIATAAMHPQLLGSHYFYMRTEFRLDSIAWGVVLACLCEFASGRSLLLKAASRPALMTGMAALVFALVFRDDFFRETWRYSVLGAGIFLLLTNVLFQPRLRRAHWLLNSGPFVFIGRLSYSLYVWHNVAPQIVDFLGASRSPIAVLLLEALVAFLMALGSYYLVERPILDLRRRFGSRAPAANEGVVTA